ncbi:MAG: class I SAM-dependent methyltransferase [Bifidobacteriaceae bacterium]|nr:class I SAM-dependent methyltransferase [Bifidobacteriaceae bacterium]
MGEFLALDFKPESFDLVCLVASLHHMDLEPALAKAVGLLRPGGRLRIVGLSRNASLWDWILSGLRVPPVRVAGWLRHESRQPEMVVREPALSHAELRRETKPVLPGRPPPRRGKRSALRPTSPAGCTDPRARRS